MVLLSAPGLAGETGVDQAALQVESRCREHQGEEECCSGNRGAPPGERPLITPFRSSFPNFRPRTVNWTLGSHRVQLTRVGRCETLTAAQPQPS